MVSFSKALERRESAGQVYFCLSYGNWNLDTNILDKGRVPSVWYILTFWICVKGAFKTNDWHILLSLFPFHPHFYLLHLIFSNSAVVGITFLSADLIPFPLYWAVYLFLVFSYLLLKWNQYVTIKQYALFILMIHCVENNSLLLSHGFFLHQRGWLMCFCLCSLYPSVPSPLK